MGFVESNKIIEMAPIITPITTLFIGAWVGNRYAINKDRRAEFLKVSIPIHEILVAQIHAEGNAIFFDRVDDSDLLKLRSFYFHRTWLDKIKGYGLDVAIKQYQEQYQASYSFDGTGRVTYKNHANYLKAIHGLLKYASIK